MKSKASALAGLNGERVALQDVAVSAVLRDLLAEVTLTQTYRNDEAVNIEAVYTFPLPVDAVLLDLDVTIGERVLRGVVVEKCKAEARYEDAIEAGDAAVMLEATEPGLYTMNVGNLLAGETVKIRFRYGILYRWTGERLRFFLPTTIAPRYGESPHAPAQAPEASLTVENRFSLRVEVYGALREARFECPTHRVELIQTDEQTVLRLEKDRAVMDRDFVLNVSAPEAERSFVLCGQDGPGDGVAAIASFQPRFRGLQQPRALNLAIVVDCSGSMQGDSLEQARAALDGILQSLQPGDRVSIVAFGSHTKALADHPLPCQQTHLAEARRFVQALAADMGGTELGEALREAVRIAGGAGAVDVFLLTDGEVSGWEPIANEAGRAGHRIFTVGVGSAVSEALVRKLAEVTGGACELVSPGEGMTERVVRHFERMRAPRAPKVSVVWPEGAERISPRRIGAVFEGDTVVACAHFPGRPADSRVIIELENEQGQKSCQVLDIPETTAATTEDGLSTIARMAAAQRLPRLDSTTGLKVALQYQLMSRWTNTLVVAERAEGDKALDMPALRRVAQTMAAGWGGTGTVVHEMLARLDMVPAAAPPSAPGERLLSARFAADIDVDRAPTSRRRMGGAAPRSPDHLGFAVPGFSRAERAEEQPDEFSRLFAIIAADPDTLRFSQALELLERSGLAAEFDDLLRMARDLGLSTRAVAAIIVAQLLQGPVADRLPREARKRLSAFVAETREARRALHEMAHLGTRAGHVLDGPMVHMLLEHRFDQDALRRFAHMDELLERIDQGVQRHLAQAATRLETPF